MMDRGSLAARLLAAFLEDLEEQLRTMDADLLALEASPGDAEHLRSLFRAAHTIKGAARAANLPAVEEGCHALEARLAEVREGRLVLAPGEFRALFSAVDALRDAGDRLRAGKPLDDARVARLLEPPGEPGPAAPPPEPAREAPPPRPAQAPVPTAAPTAVPERSDASVRVDAEKLDALLASASQLVIARGRVALRPTEVGALRDLCASVEARHRRAARAVRAALERAGEAPGVAGALAAVEADLYRASREAARLAAAVVGDARAVAHAADEVADRVRRLRVRPFGDACDALPRVVRDVADASGKEARLVVAGGAVEADREVIESLREALLHLVRNAVDHGIEPPAERERAGKARAGIVSVSAAVRGERLTVAVTDDGRGVDLGAIRDALARRGLPVPAGERELARTLFTGGISTRAEATRISGRGVGLDAVRASAERLRGTVEVSWEEGRGTTFLLETPLTLATLRALLVRVGDHLLALPTAALDALVRVRPEEVGRVEGRDVLAVAGAPVALVTLARVLGPPLREAAVGGVRVAAVLRAGDRRLAAVFDDALGEQEVVVRPLERPEGPLPHLSGAAILGTGEVALVLDPHALVETGLGLPGAAPVAARGGAGEPPRRRVLVVDDSITTRTLEQSTLEAAGYEVVTAVDGADGWRKLQEDGADLVVSDVEMPRMSGFELCEAIRASLRFASLPVILVTSLDSPEHRARGLEAGADAYVGKSGFDQQGLLEMVRQLIE